MDLVGCRRRVGGAYRAAGADATMWVPITYVIGPLGTSLLAIKFGEGGWTKLDRICLVGVGIGLILWRLDLLAVVARQREQTQSNLNSSTFLVPRRYYNYGR